MKYIIIIIIGLSIFSLSFKKQDNIGKALFENSCKSCHLPNKATAIAPSFQNIRKDYGLQWTLAFIKDSRSLKNKKDICALYSYYLFGNHKHTMFPALKAKYVVKILDYVDKFPADTSQYKHRFVSYSQKQKYVYEHLAKDTIREQINWVDTTFSEGNKNNTDTFQNNFKRKSYRRTNPKHKEN